MEKWQENNNNILPSFVFLVLGVRAFCVDAPTAADTVVVVVVAVVAAATVVVVADSVDVVEARRAVVVVVAGVGVPDVAQAPKKQEFRIHFFKATKKSIQTISKFIQHKIQIYACMAISKY